jgi:hypothetical protein
MMNKHAMQELLQEMKSAAELVLLRDAAFFEVLHALKSEIDGNPKVKSAVRNLRAAGQTVFCSFVPDIKVQIRTKEGLVAASEPARAPEPAAVGPIARLTRELWSAASSVIMTSRHCKELGRIVNEAVTSSESFENIASQVEDAGYEVSINIDLSAYAQVQTSSAMEQSDEAKRTDLSEEPLEIELSSYDLRFLKQLKIKTDESLPHQD